MAKIVIKGEDARKKIIDGVIEASDAIITTLGPAGKFVAIENSMIGPEISRDGATVAKSISFKDGAKNAGAMLVRKAASLTEDLVGDGPQPLWAKILTPNGWITMGDVKVGDKICGTNGSVQEVIGVFDKGEKEIYKVHFANGQVVECSLDHLWTVTTNNDTKKTLTLNDIINEGITKPIKDGSRLFKFYTPKTEVEFSKKDLLIDPYLLGLLLGDGCLCSSGSIELSLGYKKLGVLDNIVLPENIQYSSKDFPDKNYVRVKFSRINKEKKDQDMHVYLDKLGLLDKKSDSKFIPKQYLYSSKEDRVNLLSGLMSTDGYLNNKGLYEYSTVSKQLADDIVELMNSLGMTVSVRVHTRENDQDSYSKKDIYRITQLVGYKNGTKITGIEKTGVIAETRCIKVSNDDELYITNDYIVTHNTSTSACLIKEFCSKGEREIRNKRNVSEVKSGMIKASEWVKKFIKDNSIEIGDDLEKIRRVATISANNDPEVGNLIVESMKKVGIDGVITAELSSGLDTVVEITEGMKIERGWASPEYTTEKGEGKCIMEDCYVFICGTRLSNVNQLIPFLELIQKDGGNKPFLLICDGIDDVVNSTLLINTMRGAIRCCVVKDIDFGDGRKNQMQDIATKVGATYFCPENGKDIKDIEFDDLGHASKVVVSRDNTIIYEGAGNPDEIKARAEILRKNLADPSRTAYDKIKFSKRLANLTNGIAVIKAGGATEVEKCNRKATIEDAILASKSAISEGCVPGGGYIYYKAAQAIQKDKKWWKDLEGDEVIGAEIVVESLPSILRTVAENAGMPGDVIIEWSEVKPKVFMNNMGFNAKTRKWSDLLEDGVLDSAKVARVALENSISTASMILATDCIILEDDEDKKAANPLGV